MNCIQFYVVNNVPLDELRNGLCLARYTWRLCELASSNKMNRT